MSSADRPISIRDLNAASADLVPGAAVVELPMNAHDRRRVRRLVTASDGTVLALELPTGTVLHPGQILYQDGHSAYVVTAADEDVLVIRPRDVAEAARVGHLIGNLHRDIDVDGNEIVTFAESTLADRLSKIGVAVEQTRRPFRGRAPGDHAH
jgi:urease accessory protein